MVAFGGLVYGRWLDTRFARCLEIVFGVGGGAGLISERGVFQARWQALSGRLSEPSLYRKGVGGEPPLTDIVYNCFISQAELRQHEDTTLRFPLATNCMLLPILPASFPPAATTMHALPHHVRSPTRAFLKLIRRSRAFKTPPPALAQLGPALCRRAS